MERKINEPCVFKTGFTLAEVNLIKYPFNLLSNNRLDKLLEEAARKKKSHIACELIMPDGTKRVWRVNPSIELGYTRPFDKKVFMTILKLVTDEGLPPPVVWELGSLRRVCQTMGLEDCGRNKRLVKESLIRISQTAIYAEVFYLKERGEFWREKPGSLGGSFTLWNVIWRGEKLPNGEIADSIYLAFNIPFIWSLQAYYVCPLDYEYWLSLPPLAQRLYELTGRRFYGLTLSEYARYDYEELCQLLPLQPQKYLSDAKRILDRAHDILKSTGWFSKVQWVIKKAPKNKRPWEILYYPGPRAKEEIAQAKERLAKLRQLGLSPVDIETELMEKARIEYFVDEIEKITGDTHSKATYIKIVKALPDDVLWRFLSELKADYLHGPLTVRESLAAIFMDKVKRYCQEHGLDIGIKFKT
ncbi:MAG: hypothetical protein ABDI20_08710 [Candidatus Bipolaricaulaceae bacterium]